MKVCKVCNKPKDLTEFYVDKTCNDGHWSKCKECAKHAANTPSMLAKRTLRSQRASCKRRGHPPPVYTAQELEKWLLTQPNFSTLMNEWKASGYAKMQAPSIDRLDDYDTYHFDNIQLTTWQENRDKLNIDKISGRNNKTSTSVSSGGVTYHSISDASRKTGINRASIRNCILKGISDKNGNYWSSNA